MKLNKISIPELTKSINTLGKPEKIGQQKQFYLSGQIFLCESGMKRGCFKMEWKIIEIKTSADNKIVSQKITVQKQK